MYIHILYINSVKINKHKHIYTIYIYMFVHRPELWPSPSPPPQRHPWNITHGDQWLINTLIFSFANTTFNLVLDVVASEFNLKGDDCAMDIQYICIYICVYLCIRTCSTPCNALYT